MKSFFCRLSVIIILAVLSAGMSFGRLKDNNSKKYQIKSSVVRYVSGIDTVSAYLAEPIGKGKFPALILVHEWWGLTQWMKENADDFARRGITALAVDLYRGKVTSDFKEAAQLSSTLPKERAITDLKSAFSYLVKMKSVDNKRIGSIGWCFGGGYSFQTALNIPKLKACVVCYGSLDYTGHSLKEIHCPVLCVYGDSDKVFTPNVVEKFAKAAKKNSIKTKVIFYPEGKHAFMNSYNKNSYNEKDSKKAWSDIYLFLEKKLI